MTTALALQLLPWALGLAAGIAGIWQNNKRKGAEKALDTVILAVEHATELPQAKQTEKIIKGAIQSRAILKGVEPLIRDRVRGLTNIPPSVDVDEQLTRKHVELELDALGVAPRPTDDAGAADE